MRELFAYHGDEIQNDTRMRQPQSAQHAVVRVRRRRTKAGVLPSRRRDEEQVREVRTTQGSSYERAVPQVLG